jgi:predicted phosphodiesterase
MNNFHRALKNAQLALTIIPVILTAVSCRPEITGLFASPDFSERESSWDGNIMAQNKTPYFGPSYSFIVAADTHIKEGGTPPDYGERYARLKNHLLPSDRFIVVAGDCTDAGNRAQIKKFRAISENMGRPVYPVLGNHDIYHSGFPNWKELIGSSVYRIDGDSAMLLMLDSANGTLGARQIDWVKKNMAARNAGQKNVFVFSHMNLFTAESFSLNSLEQLTDIRERARLLSLFSGKAAMVFTGHTHLRVLHKAGGVDYVSVEAFRDTGAFVRVYVDGGGVRYTFEKVDA